MTCQFGNYKRKTDLDQSDSNFFVEVSKKKTRNGTRIEQFAVSAQKLIKNLSIRYLHRIAIILYRLKKINFESIFCDGQLLYI